MLFFLARDNKHAISAGEKMAGGVKTGEVIVLTTPERDEWKAGGVQIINTGSEQSPMTEIDFSKKYVLFANESVHINDIITLSDAMFENYGGGIAIIRTMK